MAVRSFLSVKAYQLGVKVWAWMFLIFAILILSVNVFDFIVNDNQVSYVPLIIIVSFVLLMATTGYLMLLSTYKESRGLADVSWLLIMLTTIGWFCLTIISFANGYSQCELVCNHLKCPETFWMADMKYKVAWRNEFYHKNKSLNTTAAVETAIKSSQETTSTTNASKSTSEDRGYVEDIVTARVKLLQAAQELTHDEAVNTVIQLNPNLKKFSYNAFSLQIPNITESKDSTEQTELASKNLNSSKQSSDILYNSLNDNASALISQSLHEDTDYESFDSLTGAIICAVCNLFLFIHASILVDSYSQRLLLIEKFEAKLKQMIRRSYLIRYTPKKMLRGSKKIHTTT